MHLFIVKKILLYNNISRYIRYIVHTIFTKYTKISFVIISTKIEYFISKE